MNKLKRVVSKPVRLPLNWALPRHAVSGLKEFRFKSIRYPICPNCSLSRFELKPEPNEDNEAVWCCPSCKFETTTSGNELKDIQEWCHFNAREVFDNSEYQQNRIYDYKTDVKDNFTVTNINRNMFGCYAFVFLAFATGGLFVYAALNAQYFFMINTLMFTLVCLFVALTFNYRGWQAMTNEIYSEDGRAQFHWWLKSHPWFTPPKDIGSPPAPQKPSQEDTTPTESD